MRVSVCVHTCLLLCVWNDDKVTFWPILKEKIPVYRDSLGIPEREVAVTSNMTFLEMLLDVLLVKAFTIAEYSSEDLQRWQILLFWGRFWFGGGKLPKVGQSHGGDQSDQLGSEKWQKVHLVCWGSFGNPSHASWSAPLTAPRGPREAGWGVLSGWGTCRAVSSPMVLLRPGSKQAVVRHSLTHWHATYGSWQQLCEACQAACTRFPWLPSRDGKRPLGCNHSTACKGTQGPVVRGQPGLLQTFHFVLYTKA